MAARLCNLPSDFGEHFLHYKPSLKQRIQARRFANESYIVSTSFFHGNNGEIHVKCSVFPSQRKREKPHQINMAVKVDCISDAHCTCKAGVSGGCAHVVCVVLKLTEWLTDGLTDVPSEPSCTSRPQQWDKPRGNKICPEPVSTMVLARSSNENRKRRPLTPVFCDNRKIQLLDRDISLLQSMQNTPLGYLACKPFTTYETTHGPQNVSSTLSHQLPLLQPLDVPVSGSGCATDWEFPSTPDVMNLDIVADYEESFIDVNLSREEAIKIEIDTQNQADCDLWHSERRKRITASNFGKIMNRKQPVNAKCFNNILNSKSFTSAATSYGTSNEKIARNTYVRRTNSHVHACGLMVNPLFPCLGASPDGRVCDQDQSGILEIKCPYSARDDTILGAIENKPDFHLTVTNNDVTLKKGHNYWWQVQGQLLVSGAKYCDFVTFTRHDCSIIRVKPDKEAMEELLSKLCHVFSKFSKTS